MSLTGLDVFDETVHKTNTWLKEIAKALGLERHGAYQVLRAVLHALRDRLTIDENMGLDFTYMARRTDQLPRADRAPFPCRSESREVLSIT